MNSHAKFCAIKNYFFMLAKITKLSPSYVTLSMIASILENIAPIASIIVLQIIINELNKSAPSIRIVLAVLLVFIAYTFLFSIVITLLTAIILPKQRQLISLTLRAEIYQVTQVVPLEMYDDPEFFNILTITLQEADGQSLGVIDSFATLFSILLSVGMLVSLIISVEPILVIISSASAVISFIYGLKSSKMNAEYIEETAPVSRRNAFIQQVFTQKSYSQELRINNAARLFLRHLNENTNKLVQILLSRGKKAFCFQVQNSFINTFFLSLNIGLLSWKVISNNVPIGNVFAALSGSQQLTDQLSIFSKHISQIYQQGLIIEKYRKFFRMYDRKENRIASRILPPKQPVIELKNVSFRYKHAQEDTLSKISLKITHGEHIAIVGPNGSGKSTLARIIAGLYIPENGEILVNGDNYCTYNSDDIFQLFSFVFQDFKIAPLTIAENILMSPFSNTEACRSIIDKALEFSQLKNKVELFPAGVLTELTKEFNRNGSVLSGGELQKLAIARAYAQDKPVVIFDEATSALDTLSEKQFVLDSTKLFSSKTIIWITHRAQCLEFVDKIYYMDNGRIAEHGSFNELIQRRGKFFNMFSKQLNTEGDSSYD